MILPPRSLVFACLQGSLHFAVVDVTTKFGEELVPEEGFETLEQVVLLTWLELMV